MYGHVSDVNIIQKKNIAFVHLDARFADYAIEVRDLITHLEFLEINNQIYANQVI